MKPPKKENRVISMEKFASLHSEAKSWDEVNALLGRLRRDTKEKFDVAYEEAGKSTSRTGRKHAVFVVGERNNIGNGITYHFRTMEIDGLNTDTLANFVERLGNFQLIRATFAV
jgi:hypothetical protein